MTYSFSLAFDLRHRHPPFSLASKSPPGDENPSVAAEEFGPAEHDDLPYRVELWDVTKNGVEQVLAVTANASIGYAAYYAATREHPERYVTLRHKDNFVSRWNGPAN